MEKIILPITACLLNITLIAICYNMYVSFSTEETCHLQTTENEISIEFPDGKAQKMILSPFEKNKVLIKFEDADTPLIEYDLISKDTQILKDILGERLFSQNSALYQNKKDSIVWIGSLNKELLSYDPKTKKTKAFGIRDVTRIVPYKTKIYFVAYRGLYIKDRAADKIEKVNNLPLRRIQNSYLLDDQTLIIDAKITYDLSTNTWKKGAQLYKENIAVLSYSLMAKDGIAVFEKNKELYYATLKGRNNIRIGDRYGINMTAIDKPYVYKMEQNIIDRYNVETDELVSFDYPFPKVHHYRPTFRYDGDIIWICLRGQIYFIDTVTKESHHFPIPRREHFKSMIYDDCNIYLLYEKRLEVKNKSEFIANCPKFSKTEYVAELKGFKNFVDSTKVKIESNEKIALQKLNLIKEKYVNTTHPEILTQLDYLNSSAFYSVKYETSIDLQKCYQNEGIPKVHRIICFQSLLNKEVLQSNFRQVLEYEKDIKNSFGVNTWQNMNGIYYMQSDIDSISAYVTRTDSINKLNTTRDTIDYYKAMALNTVCRTSFYCGEGCGGCDHSLVINALNNFIDKFPYSDLVDNATCELIEYKYMYDTYDNPTEITKDFEMFVSKFPNSDLLAEVEYRILLHYYYSLDAKDKIGLIENFENYINKYPSSSPKVEHIKRCMDELGRTIRY